MSREIKACTIDRGSEDEAEEREETEINFGTKITRIKRGLRLKVILKAEGLGALPLPSFASRKTLNGKKTGIEEERGEEG